MLEGSATDICHGKPIAYLGHKVNCPQCKGVFPIIEGVLTTSFYGKGVAVAGMKTACGAILIATQFTDTVEWSSGIEGSSAAGKAAAVAAAATSPIVVSGALAAGTDGSSDQQVYDEQLALPALAADGVPYLIVTPDGQRFSGRADSSGALPRIKTDGEIDYEVYWGDEALARLDGGAV